MKLQVNDDLFLIDLNHVCYFQADDHYAHVYYDTNICRMLPLGLGVLECKIKDLLKSNSLFIRVGRKFIINKSKVIYINCQHKQVRLAHVVDGTYELFLTKTGVRNLMEAVRQKKSDL